MEWFDGYDPDEQGTTGTLITSEQLRKNQILLDALCNDDVGLLESFFLEQGLSPDAYLYYNGGKRPIISIAVQRKSLNVVRLLCKKGSSLTVEDKLDNSKQPLHIAIDRSFKEISLALILEFGADPSVCNRTGRNAFHFAALQKEEEILGACIRSGSLRGIDLVDSGGCASSNQCGYTPLMYIFAGPVPERDTMVEELIGTGLINFSRLSRRGETILEVACSSLFLQLSPLKSLLKHMKAKLGPDKMRAEMKRRSVDGETILTLTLRSNPWHNPGNLSISRTDWKVSRLIRWLIREGADIDQQNIQGETAIFVSLDKRFYKTTATLLDAGCSLDVRNNDGLCPLSKACFLDNVTLIDMLLECRGYHGSRSCCRQYILGDPGVYDLVREEVRQRVRDHIPSQPQSLLQLARDAVRKNLRGSWRRNLAPHLPSTLCKDAFPSLSKLLK